MLGWFVSVYPTGVDISCPPPSSVPSSARPVAQWRAGISGLRWLEELCRAGSGVFLGGNGYPFRYAVHAASAKSPLLETPTRISRTEFVDAPAPLSGGEGVRLASEIAEIPDGHWVMFEAFDMS